MAMGGPPVGSPFGGPRSVASSRDAGLPFAGVPSELAEAADVILESEPEHADPNVGFDPINPDSRRLTLQTLLRPHWAAVGFAVMLVVVETLTMLAGPALIQQGIDKGVRAGSRSVLVVVVAIYLGTIAVNAVVNRFRISYTGRLGERLMFGLRVKVFSHLQRLSLDFHTEEKSGVLLSRMTSDIDSLTVLMQDSLISIVVQVLTLLVVIVILFIYNPLLAAITLGLVVPALLSMTMWFRRVSDRGYSEVRDRIADVLADLQESLSGIRVIAASNRRRHNVVHHHNVVGRYQDANVYTARIGTIYGPGSEALGVVAQAIVLLFGGWMVLDGRLQLGELAAFVLYLTTFFAPIQQLVQLYSTYQAGRAAIRKLGDLLDTAPAVADAVGAVELEPVEGEIRIENVTFAYGNETVLHDIDLKIEPGETFALVGPTGAGKSTVAKLVTRFYDPQVGRVLIDGVDLRTVTQRSLRRQLGVVPQEPFLFYGTVRENIAFARPDASEAEIAEACTLVGINDLVERLPDGLDSPVHERGASLSAGERQLLALARAFLARPRVLILDEATSNLDLLSETRIERALDVLLQGRTAIVIAHRLATAMRADRIAVVDEGRIVELGSHDELVAHGGRYAEMYATWVSHSEGASGSISR